MSPTVFVAGLFVVAFFSRIFALIVALLIWAYEDPFGAEADENSRQ